MDDGPRARLLKVALLAGLLVLGGAGCAKSVELKSTVTTSTSSTSGQLTLPLPTSTAVVVKLVTVPDHSDGCTQSAGVGSAIPWKEGGTRVQLVTSLGLDSILSKFVDKDVGIAEGQGWKMYQMCVRKDGSEIRAFMLQMADTSPQTTQGSIEVFKGDEWARVAYWHINTATSKKTVAYSRTIRTGGGNNDFGLDIRWPSGFTNRVDPVIQIGTGAGDMGAYWNAVLTFDPAKQVTNYLGRCDFFQDSPAICTKGYTEDRWQTFDALPKPPTLY